MTYSWADEKINAIRAIVAAGSAFAVLCLSAPSFAQQKADIAALNERLFTAVRSNDIATVRSSLTDGADPMALDANGQTPAGVAIDRGYFPIAHHILGVRNQRQALGVRSQEEERLNPTAAASRAAKSAAPEDRTPQSTWRDTTVSGQAAEIPSPRISSPKEAVVISPVMAPAAAPKAAPNKGPPAGTQPASTPSAAPAPAKSAPVAPATQSAPAAPALANLPRLAPGAPNPFDPRLPEPAAPPVLSAADPVAPTPRDVKSQPNEPSGPNALTRFFNGITGVFGGGGS